MNCVQENPHRVRRVGQPIGRKCICFKHIAELVVCMRNGNRDQWEKAESHKNWEECKGNDCESLLSGQTRSEPFDFAEKSLPQSREKPCK